MVLIICKHLQVPKQINRIPLLFCANFVQVLRYILNSKKVYFLSSRILKPMFNSNTNSPFSKVLNYLIYIWLNKNENVISANYKNTLPFINKN